jgi:hypothetical protein
LHQQGGRCWTGWGARWAPPPLCPRPAWSAASQTAAWDRRHEAWRSRSAPQRATPHDWRWQASHHHGHHPPPRPRLWASEISAKARRRRGGRAVTVGKGAGQVDPRRRKLLHLYGPLTSHNTASARERKGRCIGLSPRSAVCRLRPGVARTSMPVSSPWWCAPRAPACTAPPVSPSVRTCVSHATPKRAHRPARGGVVSLRPPTPLAAAPVTPLAAIMIDLCTATVV